MGNTKLTNELKVERPRTFLDLKGSVKSKKKYTDAEMDQAILKYIKSTYEKLN